MNYLDGKRVCFTGNLSWMSRSAAQMIVSGYNGVPVVAVTESTDYLVVGANAGLTKKGRQTSHLRRAEKLGVTIVDQSVFMTWIGLDPLEDE